MRLHAALIIFLATAIASCSSSDGSESSRSETVEPGMVHTLTATDIQDLHQVVREHDH